MTPRGMRRNPRGACALASRSAAWWWLAAVAAVVLHGTCGVPALFLFAVGAAALALMCYRIWAALAWLETR